MLAIVLLMNGICRIEVFKLVLKFHEIGIAHGDIRPQNFLRCDDGTFKMIDFTVSEFHKCEGKLDVSILYFCNSPSCDLCI